jgi:hypothetical protein
VIRKLLAQVLELVVDEIDGGSDDDLNAVLAGAQNAGGTCGLAKRFVRTYNRKKLG